MSGAEVQGPKGPGAPLPCSQESRTLAGPAAEAPHTEPLRLSEHQNQGH